jgi:hypothetical protein
MLRRLGAMAAAPDAPPAFSREARAVAPPPPAEAVFQLRPAEPSTGPGPFSAPMTSAAAPSAPPNEAAPVPFETDAALRSALATLQRMTARG